MQLVAEVKGMVMPAVHTNLSMLDAKAAFTAAQRTPDSGATPDSGGSARAVVDLAEFQMALALCGTIKYEEVEQMSLAQRVAGVTANFLGEKDEVAVVNEVIVTKMERHDPFKSFPPTGLSAKQHRYFLDEVWAKMDLGHLFGFPLWEKAVFMLLHRSFPELQSIFVTYSRRGTAESGSLETMEQTELVDLVLDCGLATKAFPMARVQAVFDGKAGDQALELREFLEVVVQLAFSRANPRFGEVGHERVTPSHPLPDCLDVMLQQNLLRKAKQDSLVKIKKMASKEPAVLAVLRPLRPQLKKRFTHLLASGSEKDLARSRQKAMSVEMFCTDLFDRGVTKEITLRPTAAVKGALLPDVHSSLSHLDAKRAFAISQEGGDIMSPVSQTVSFDEYVMALVLCGHMKYEEVEGMTLAQRVAGVVANLLGEKSEEQVITEVVAPRVERFNMAEAKAEDGLLSLDDHQRFLQEWNQMDLSHVHGFPLWEKEVFRTLHSSFSGIRSLFNQYAKHSGGAVSSKSLQQTELVNMALDCCLATTAFPMARVQAVFTLADVKDDGKAGDQALELHEFLEAVVQLAFARANPQFGEVGHKRVAPAHPLPDCLHAMLQKNLLKRAKLDGLAKLKMQIQGDAAAQDALQGYRVQLKEVFERMAKPDATSKRPVLSVTLFCQELFDRKVGLVWSQP